MIILGDLSTLTLQSSSYKPENKQITQSNRTTDKYIYINIYIKKNQ